MSSQRPTASKLRAPERAGKGATRSRWRRLLYWAILFEISAVLLFIGALLLGEGSRLTLTLLYLPRLPLFVAVSLGALLAPLTRRRVPLLVASQVVLGLVILFPVMGLVVTTSRTAERPIGLTSYNVFFGKAGRPALTEEVVAMSSDIVVLQAAFGSLNERLRERLPERTIRQDGEFVLISKFPVSAVVVPPPLADGTPAMYVKYVLDTPQGTLRVYSMHAFSPRHALFGERETADNIGARDAQIGATVAAARSDVSPFIIAGDTNVPGLSAVGRRHFSGLTDAFSDVGLGFGYTFPAKRPWMRIDRVLGSEGVEFNDVRVGPLGASDHRALLVRFDLQPGG